MRALWITPGYPWADNPVGFIFHQSQAQALVSLGVDVTVVAPTPWVPPMLARRHPRWAAYAAAPSIQRDGAIGIMRPRYLTTPRENVLGYAHLFQQLSLSLAGLPRPDVIHAHFAYPSGAVAVNLGRRWGVPVVLSLHGDDVTIYPHARPRMGELFRKTIKGADRILAVSPALAAMTEKLTGRRPGVLSTGIDHSKFTIRDKAAARRVLGLDEGAFVIVYVGALLLQKGVLDLAEALRRVDWPDAVALFVGGGAACPEGPTVRLLGPKTNEEIPEILAAADLFVLPSWHEGLGQAALEAAAAGLPVLGADTGGLGDLISNERGFAFPPRDIEALAQCLRNIRANPGEAASRAARLKAHVAAEHDLYRNAARLKAVYESMLAKDESLSVV